jgi:hypothetical protein
MTDLRQENLRVIQFVTGDWTSGLCAHRGTRYSR